MHMIICNIITKIMMQLNIYDMERSLDILRKKSVYQVVVILFIYISVCIKYLSLYAFSLVKICKECLTADFFPPWYNFCDISLLFNVFLRLPFGNIGPS